MEKTSTSEPSSATWLAYFYSTLVYYLSLIAESLRRRLRYERITDDKSQSRDADSAGNERVAETQTVKRCPAAAPADSSLLSSFDCNCLTPHLSSDKTSYVSTLSLPARRRPSLKKPTNSFHSSTTSIPTTVSFRSPPPSDSSSDSDSSSTATLAPIRRSRSVIGLVPADSHVFVAIPKLDWKTESIRIKRTRMSEWLDAEERDVMRQFDEVIRNEEEEDEKATSRRRGILKNGSVRSTVGSVRSRSRSSTLPDTPVFVPPPPPQEMPPFLPRLAKLEKSRPEEEFGFNLHAERGRGHFIGTVDEGGVGEKAGLEMGQRIVGVNGQLVYPDTGHKEVVALIKKSPMSTTLLVASDEVDKYYRDHALVYSFDKAEQKPIVVDTHQHHHHHHHEEVHPSKTNGYDVAPSLNPHSIQVNEEREVSKLTTTTKTEVISTANSSYQYKETTTAYNAYASPPADSDDLMAQVFGRVELPPVGNQVTIHSHTQELPEDTSSISSSLTSSHRESAVDVPVSHQYVPSYVSQSHQEDRHSQTHHQIHQQPSPLSNGSSHGYAASSTSGYDDDDIYHLSAKEARERLRMKNRKHHLHEMSLNEKYQLVSNM